MLRPLAPVPVDVDDAAVDDAVFVEVTAVVPVPCHIFGIDKRARRYSLTGMHCE